MAVYKNSTTGKWRAEPRFEGKRLPSKTFSTKAFAEKYERDVIKSLEEQALTGSLARDYTYNELYDFWYSYAFPRKRESSLTKDVQIHRDYIAPIMGKLKLSQINVIVFNKITEKVIDKGLSKNSANKVIQHFKAVFNYAFNNDLIIRNPSKNFKQFKLEVKEMEYLLQDEMDQLLSYTNQTYRGEERWKHALYLTLFLTGMRVGEVLGLRWHKINFDANTILVSNTWCSKTHRLLNTTKGKKDRRIPLSPFLKKELAPLRNKASGDFIFSCNGDKPIDVNNFRSRNWTRDYETSEVRKIRIHDARHTYASLFMMNGGNIYDLKTLLGHADIKTTERYAHLSASHLQNVRDIIKPNISEKAEVIILNDFGQPKTLPQASESKTYISVNG